MSRRIGRRKPLKCRAPFYLYRLENEKNLPSHQPGPRFFFWAEPIKQPSFCPLLTYSSAIRSTFGLLPPPKVSLPGDLASTSSPNASYSFCLRRGRNIVILRYFRHLSPFHFLAVGQFNVFSFCFCNVHMGIDPQGIGLVYIDIIAPPPVFGSLLKGGNSTKLWVISVR